MRHNVCVNLSVLIRHPCIPAELVLPGSVYNWFSIDQRQLFMNIIQGDTLRAGGRLLKICGLCQNKMSQYQSGQCLRTSRAFK